MGRDGIGDTMGEGAIWIDGRLVGSADATLSATDHGVTVGEGIFESMKVVRDRHGTPQPFAMARHLARLRRSAAGLGMSLPVSDEDLRAAVRAVLDAGPGVAARVRVTVTGGIGPLTSNAGRGAPTVIVTASAMPPWPPSTAVAVVPWRRNEHSPVAGLKTTSYVENVVALQHANERGAGEAIFANTAGNLCEGAGSNVFVVIEGRLITPPLSSGCLAGITRELLVEIIDVQQRDLPVDALASADEAFLTSSTRNVQPISTVDGLALPSCPGPLTVAAADAFAALEATTIDP